MASSLSFPRLELITTLRLDLGPKGPEKSNGQNPSFWFNIVGGATLRPDASPSAPNLEILPGSGDFATHHPEHNVLSLDVGIIAKEKSTGDLYMLKCHGSVDTSCKKVQQILSGEKTAESTQYGEGSMIETVTWTTESNEFRWMKFACLFADGRLIVENGTFVAVELRLFKVGGSGHDHASATVGQMLESGDCPPHN